MTKRTQNDLCAFCFDVRATEQNMYDDRGNLTKTVTTTISKDENNQDVVEQKTDTFAYDSMNMLIQVEQSDGITPMCVKA